MCNSVYLCTFFETSVTPVNTKDVRTKDDKSCFEIKLYGFRLESSHKFEA